MTRNSLDDDLAVEDIGVAVAALTARPECNGEVVVVGYCLGGLLALLSAARLRVLANICFHGVRLEKHPRRGQKHSRTLPDSFSGARQVCVASSSCQRQRCASEWHRHRVSRLPRGRSRVQS